MSSYKISCHCGLASQIVSCPSPSDAFSGTTSSPLDVHICHCRPCRKNTGLLCVSYLQIQAPEHTERLVAYRSTQYLKRFFCGTCGCHVFRRQEGPEGHVIWAVATGVIEDRLGDPHGKSTSSKGVAGNFSEPQYARHNNVTTTRDGGLAIYLPEIRGREMNDSSSCGKMGDDVACEIGTGERDVLLGDCHCGNVSFQVSRPDESSHVLKRSYADLIYPYCSTPPDVLANREDVKWWLRSPRFGVSVPDSRAQDQVMPTRYLAGTCACRSCRLTSGFEIQTWAFVPRSNIFFHVPVPAGADQCNLDITRTITPLDFSTLPTGILKSYPSSPGAVREFCAICGATVFWREEQGAEVVDISAGLFDAVEGARAEGWLEWWTERVSFSEEASTGRSGEVAARAVGLIESLERGMRQAKMRTM